MSSIAHPNPPPNRFNLRALIAGGTATTSLVAATLVALLSLAVYVGFDDLPFGGDGDSGDAISLGPPTAGASADGAATAAAADASGAAAGAAAGPTAGATAVAPAPGVGFPGTGVPGDDGATLGGGTANPDDLGVGGTPGATGGDNAPSALGDTVTDLESTTDQVVDLPIDEAIDDVTGPVDQGFTDTLNDGGGLLGTPDLGDQLNNTVGALGEPVLGPGGVADQVLPDRVLP